jgi:nucleoside-diphosphate-sugar epimerase
MRVLITGADGYIGTACVRAFSQQGWSVRATTRQPIRMALPKGVENIHGLSFAEAVNWALHLHNVDVVLHLAAVVHRPDAPLEEYRRINIDSTERLALEAVKAGVSRFLFLSSISVHGRNVGARSIHEDTPFAPDDAYGKSKADAEALIARVANGTRMSWSVLRPPLVYGPNAPGNFRRLVNAIQAGVPLPLAAARKTRSYIGIDNLVSAIIRVATHPSACNQSFVVSDGQDISTAEMISLIAKALERHSRIWWMPEIAIRMSAALLGRSADASRLFDPLRIDSQKIRNMLDWEALVPIEDGICRAVATKFHS